jgi:TRAP-type C4-dicarboxylate transport system permease small subunit
MLDMKPEGRLHVIRRVIEKTSTILAAIAAGALSLVMLVMAVDAIGRKVKGPLPGGYETSMALMVLVMLLPLAFAERRKANISVDLLSRLFPLRLRSLLEATGAILGVAIFVLITWLSVAAARYSTSVGEYWPGIVSYPVWPFRWIVPVGTCLAALQFLFSAIDKLKSRREA